MQESLNIIKWLDFTSSESEVIKFMQSQNSTYSNDGSIPENLTGALERATKLNWKS